MCVAVHVKRPFLYTLGTYHSKVDSGGQICSPELCHTFLVWYLL